MHVWIMYIGMHVWMTYLYVTDFCFVNPPHYLWNPAQSEIVEARAVQQHNAQLHKDLLRKSRGVFMLEHSLSQTHDMHTCASRGGRRV